jgi:hypothetical protein
VGWLGVGFAWAWQVAKMASFSSNRSKEGVEIKLLCDLLSAQTPRMPIKLVGKVLAVISISIVHLCLLLLCKRMESANIWLAAFDAQD